MIQASIVVRVLISEQKRAQRPHDTTYHDDGYATYGPGGGQSAPYASQGGGGDSFVPHARRDPYAGSRPSRDEEDGLELKEQDITAAPREDLAGAGIRPRMSRRHDSDYVYAEYTHDTRSGGGGHGQTHSYGVGSMPTSETGQSDMRASSKTAGSDHHYFEEREHTSASEQELHLHRAATSDDDKRDAPLVTLETLPR